MERFRCRRWVKKREQQGDRGYLKVEKEGWGASQTCCRCEALECF